MKYIRFVKIFVTHVPMFIVMIPSFVFNTLMGGVKLVYLVLLTIQFYLDLNTIRCVLWLMPECCKSEWTKALDGKQQQTTGNDCG